MTLLRVLLIPRRIARRPQPGQSLVLIALVMFVLMGSLGLALDGGYNISQRRGMQNAADAAALAGASEVSTNDGTGGTGYEVLSIVRDVAQRNGVRNVTSNLDCWYITDSVTILKDATGADVACSDGAIPNGARGVQVNVRETHGTFVMRVLGISQSGTAATAAARVELLSAFWPGPFTICGIDTALAPNTETWNIPGRGTAKWTGPDGSTGIFQKQTATYAPGWYPGYSGCGSSGGSPCSKTQDVNSPTVSAASAPVVNNDNSNGSLYYYDFNQGSPLGIPSAVIDHNPGRSPNKAQYGPTFQIHGPNSNPVASCNITSSGFKGVNTTIFANPVNLPGDYSPPYAPTGYGGPLGTLMSLTPGNVTSISTSVNGPYGCVAGQTLNNCVMLLPVIDNSGPGGSSPGSGAVQVAVRKFMYFWIEDTDTTGSSNAHTGKLIKNYHALGPGMPGWTPGSTDPLTIRLVK